MILSDRDIRARLQQGDLMITPEPDLLVQLQPASIDLRLSETFIVYHLPHVPCIDPRDASTVGQYAETVIIGGCPIVRWDLSKWTMEVDTLMPLELQVVFAPRR